MEEERTEGVTPADYKAQVSESRALLVRAHHELQVKNEQIQLLANENAQLLAQFKTEKEERQRLETDMQRTASMQTSAVVEGVEQRVQQGALADLTKEVKRARDELQDIYFENSRYRAEVQKLTQALDKMNEESTMEREEWKAKAVQLLQKLQEEEDNARRSRAEAEKLANDCIKLGSENLKLDQSLARQEEQIRVVLKELDDTNLKVKELTVENERLRAAAEDSRTTATNATGELTKSQEQLKLMSERVFHLIKQLEAMDKEKAQAQEDLHAAARKVATLEMRADNLQKVLDRDDRIRKQLEKKVTNEKEKATSFRLTGQEFRRKFIAEERVKAKLIDLLKTKERTMSEVMAKYKDAQWALQSQKGASGVRQKRVDELETQVKDLLTATVEFRNKVARLEAAQAKLVGVIRAKDDEIAGQRRREKQYIRKLQELTNKDDKSTAEDAPMDEATINRLLHSKDHGLGPNVQHMLGRLQISQQVFVDLAGESPAQLIERIAQRFQRLKPKATRATAAPAPHPSTMVLFRRLCQLLNPPWHSGAQMDALANVHNLVRCLNLSNLALGDDHVGLLCEFLQSNAQLVVLDLSHNQVHDEAFLTLVKHVCTTESSVQLIVLADNFISKLALKAIYLWMRGHRDVPAVFFRQNQAIGRDQPKFLPQIAARVGKRELLIDVSDNDFALGAAWDAFVASLASKSPASSVDGAVRAEIDRKIDLILSWYNPVETAPAHRRSGGAPRQAWPGAHRVQRTVSSPTLSMMVKPGRSPYVATTRVRGNATLGPSPSNFMKDAQELMVRRRMARYRDAADGPTTTMPSVFEKNARRARRVTALPRRRSTKPASTAKKRAASVKP